jgi:hypothetical protein
MANDKASSDALRTNGAKPGGAKTSPYAAGDNNGPAGDWSVVEVNAEDLRLLVASVLAAGDAVMFSCARKGTAYAVTIYHDGVPTKKWAADTEAFGEIVDFFTKIALQQLPQEIAKRLTT